MHNPFAALVTLQVNALNQYLAFTRSVLNFYLSLQPTAMRPIPISKSTSLVPLNHPANRRAR